MNAALCVTIVIWWNVKLQIDVKRCKVALKSHLSLQPCTCRIIHTCSALKEDTVAVDCGCSAGPNGLGGAAAVHTAQRWAVPAGRRPRDMLSKTTVELSHTVTQYSQGKAFERGIVSSTTAPLCCAAPEEAGFLQLQLNRGPPLSLSSTRGPCRLLGRQANASIEPLMYQLPEISNST